jgi:hypothetical protein
VSDRPKYLWRVTADHGGYTQTRHYQTAKAAEECRVRWLAGAYHPAKHPEGEDYTNPPALAVTVERSNRVTFPTDCHQHNPNQETR